MRPEARLDLHGMTQEEAHRALSHFVARAQEDGLRALLVITGKGGAGRGGVLREAVPRWLEEPLLRGRVLSVAPAQPKDGGGGALYVLLRRRR
jgi:DNA-nicking Smr family endonuclease